MITESPPNKLIQSTLTEARMEESRQFSQGEVVCRSKINAEEVLESIEEQIQDIERKLIDLKAKR